MHGGLQRIRATVGQTKTIVCAFLLTTSLLGCAVIRDQQLALRNQQLSSNIDNAIRAYEQVAPTIELRASKENVLAVLTPTQESLDPELRKESDRYLDGESRVEIYYFRSRRIPDMRTTDDEFTPYIFVNDQLVAVGWAALGGPPTVAGPPNISGAIPSSPTTSPVGANTGGVTPLGDKRVFDSSECIGPIVNGQCQGSILPNKAYHPTCHGEWIGGRCTGPLF